MINRELIRIKVVQITYSCFQNGSKNSDAAEKELLVSLSKAYDLYNSLLMLMVEVNRMALRTLEMRQSRLRRLGDTTMLSTKFVDNQFMLQLESNRQLREFSDNQKRSWADEEEFVRQLYTQIEESETYKTYMNTPGRTYAEDRELWRHIYREFICDNDELDDLLEDMSLYWNDDKAIVDTFVLKTINRFSEKSDAGQPLLPEFRSDADKEFATRLIHRTLANAEYYQSLIAASTRRWEVKRVALMDRVILQVALAEIISFPNIPVSVSINEYIEIAKMYSTPKSARYINGTLDAIVNQLIEDNKLIKDVPDNRDAQGN
ncbi:MAG: transcription antitermination factor NusB [Bacteroidaceae bacterium]|nr:transcription antitermination factor NusB [Bacteroidaceae bacterium]